MADEYGEWQRGITDEPGDQQLDLKDGYWAELGPDDRQRGWAWTILHASDGDDSIAYGFAFSEAVAKASVARWAEENL